MGIGVKPVILYGACMSKFHEVALFVESLRTEFFSFAVPLISWFFGGIVLAVFGLLVGAGARASDGYLEPEAAFRISAKMLDSKTITVTYTIADGYYIYRERLKFRAEGAKLGKAEIPSGNVKFDETFQKEVETFRNLITIRIPVDASNDFVLYATSQGCADKGLCYAPMESDIKLSPSGAKKPTATVDRKLGASDVQRARVVGSANARISAKALPDTQPLASIPVESKSPEKPVQDSRVFATPSVQSGNSDMGIVELSLKSRRLLAILPLFFLFGLGLSFTPCVLPMVPILSFIIVGEGAQVRPLRGFVLSATYSMGMAIVYTSLGIAAGLAGEGLAASLQNPWVLSAFALLMVGLSLSMFDVYQLQVPASIQARLVKTSEAQAAGKLLGVFVMGAISALIAGPCIAAPLAGALLYISQTKDIVIGGGALFSLAAGLSVPLLLVGISAGSLLPRSGAWMELVKRFFGVLMIATALWIVSPVLPVVVQMLSWSALTVTYGMFLLRLSGGWLASALGLILVLIGATQLIGVASGGRDVLAPLAHFRGESARKVEFMRIKSSADLDNMLAQGRGKMAILDFYADWCVSCKEMEKLTFSDPRVQARVANVVLLQADVTGNDPIDREMLKRFKLFGPPGIIFFDRNGQELEGWRVIGYQDADQFLRSLAVLTEH